MGWLPTELQDFKSFVFAEIDRSGRVRESNAGWWRLLPKGYDPARSVEPYFVHPKFGQWPDMAADADSLIYTGLITVGSGAGGARSLTGRIWRIDTGFRLLAESEIDELEKVNWALHKINNAYAGRHRELAQTNLKLRQREADARNQSLTDMLTGIGNRRSLEAVLAREIDRVESGEGTLSALMADLDHFKSINDVYGHDVGDRVLKCFGDLLKVQVRGTDFASRYGGEEFMILLPGTHLSIAVAVANRIRLALAGKQIPPLNETVTVSFGAAEHRKGETAEAFLQRVDQALYRAKSGGRNRTEADE